MEQDDSMNDKVGEGIEEIRRRTGLTEAEARARYHLRKAEDALIEVCGTPVRPDEEPMGSLYALTDVTPHFGALQNFLARRVLERERPEGWSWPGSEEEEED